MILLTKGKTNWKYILIVVILAAIVGGGVLYYYQKFPEIKFPTIRIPPIIGEKVTISTDKTEYTQGERVKVMIKNNSRVSIYFDSCFPCSFVEKESGEYKFTRPLCEVVWISEEFKPGEVKTIEKEFSSPGMYRLSCAYWVNCTKECVPGTIEKKIDGFECFIKKTSKFAVSIPTDQPTPLIPSFCDKEVDIHSNEFTIKGKLDETANWKIYRNEEYGFEIKYPPSLFLAINSLQSENLEITFYGVVHSTIEQEMRISFQPELIDINGKRAVVTIFSPRIGAPKEVKEFLIEKSQGELIDISCRFRDDESLKLCDQILSTFRFLE